MTFEQWCYSVDGRGIDYDGAYGVQCVDLVKHFIKNVLEVTPQSIGDAKQYWYKRNQPYLYNLCSAFENQPPKPGDIFVRTTGEWGHVGICTGNIEGNYFYAYEQNYHGKHDKCALHRIGSYTDSKFHFLRPYNQKNIGNTIPSRPTPLPGGSDLPTYNKNPNFIEIDYYNYGGWGKILSDGPIYKLPETTYTYFNRIEGQDFQYLGLSKDSNYWYGIIYGICGATCYGFIPYYDVSAGNRYRRDGTTTESICKKEFF